MGECGVKAGPVFSTKDDVVSFSGFGEVRMQDKLVLGTVGSVRRWKFPRRVCRWSHWVFRSPTINTVSRPVKNDRAETRSLSCIRFSIEQGGPEAYRRSLHTWSRPTTYLDGWHASTNSTAPCSFAGRCQLHLLRPSSYVGAKEEGRRILASR